MKFNETVMKKLVHSLTEGEGAPAFCIEDEFYSYWELAACVARIRGALRRVDEKYIGLVANDDLETYASIFALWMEGKCYVPLHPLQPLGRCLDIVGQVGMKTILDSSEETRYEGCHVVMTRTLEDGDALTDRPVECADSETAYILFTSGTTGRPKGVPITRGNVAAFMEAFEALGMEIGPDDRCLQMFDLTFDLSVQSYLIPVLAGACTYTVAPNRIKYQAVFELLDEYRLTFAMMVPSVIHYLRPYMDEIDVPEMRYSLFAGEGLPVDDTECWSRSVPCAEVWNVYGPTEDTIYCTAYRYEREEECKAVNGIMSIGRPMKDVDTLIVDVDCKVVETGERGELCLAGPQLTPGYWHDEEKNRQAFFLLDGKRYYRTGDICSVDADGDIAYYGRKDSQIKIQGFRIELSEIECVARKFFHDEAAVVALPVYDARKNCSISLAVETRDHNCGDSLMKHMKALLPTYMLPQTIHFLDRFPLNVNNKIDRKKIAQMV